jgi:hypothetical protein
VTMASDRPSPSRSLSLRRQASAIPIYCASKHWRAFAGGGNKRGPPQLAARQHRPRGSSIQFLVMVITYARPRLCHILHRKSSWTPPDLPPESPVGYPDDITPNLGLPPRHCGVFLLVSYWAKSRLDSPRTSWARRQRLFTPSGPSTIQPWPNCRSATC